MGSAPNALYLILSTGKIIDPIRQNCIRGAIRNFRDYSMSLNFWVAPRIFQIIAVIIQVVYRYE